MLVDPACKPYMPAWHAHRWIGQGRVDPIVLDDGDRASVVKALSSAWGGTSTAYEAIAGEGPCAGRQQHAPDVHMQGSVLLSKCQELVFVVMSLSVLY